MPPSRTTLRFAAAFGLTAALTLTLAAAQAHAQSSQPRFQLGLLDSRAGEVEILPDVVLSGVEVLEVVPEGPAARAGVRAGDVVLLAGADRVSSPDDLRRALNDSGGLLRLKVYQRRTGQVLNVDLRLRPNGPAPAPDLLRLSGKLGTQVAAIGGETTGTTLTTAAGAEFDLDFGAGVPPGPESDGRNATVSGLLRSSPGPERPGRKIIRVTSFRLDDPPRPGARPF